MTTRTHEVDQDVVRILATELKTYNGIKAKLRKSALGKYVLVRREEVRGPYEAEMDAINDGYRLYGHVPFLVKRVEHVEQLKRSRLPTQSKRVTAKETAAHIIG